MPVSVTSTPAAAVAAIPWALRIRTLAAGPVLGPIGSWPTVNITISSAIESKIETCTPIAWSLSQSRSDGQQREGGKSCRAVSRRPRKSYPFHSIFAHYFP